MSFRGEIYSDLTKRMVKAYAYSPLSEETIKPEAVTGSPMGGECIFDL